MAHGRHVARLAGSIFTNWPTAYELDPLDAPLLEAAARLQDVGYLINYDQHHKHSYHLILNSRLAGFQPHELELIANVARYHRGAEPKHKHANFRQLSAARSAARAADGRHPARGRRPGPQQHPAGQRRDGRAGQEGRHHAAAGRQQFPEVDIWGARKRSKLFEKVFDTTLDIQWSDPAEQLAPAASSPRRHQRQSPRPRRTANRRGTIDRWNGSVDVVLSSPEVHNGLKKTPRVHTSRPAR